MENVYEKKNEILHTAIYLFSSNGFSNTSMQDIASRCNISKATIYKIFKSKEDLLIEIIKHLNKQIILLTENIDLNSNMTIKEKFEEKLYVFFDHLYNKKDFTIMLYQEPALRNSKVVQKVFSESRFFILNWFKNILLDTYGERLIKNVWDVVISLVGIIKEFSQVFIIKELINRDLRDVTRYIILNIDKIVEVSLNCNPLISSESIIYYQLDSEKIFNDSLLLTEASNLVEKINYSIKLSKTLFNKEEIIEALNTLVDEKFNKSSRKYIIDGLFLYLEKYKELENDILLLKQIYKKI